MISLPRHDKRSIFGEEAALHPTDKNLKSWKSFRKEPEAEAGIEFFTSHALCGGLLRFLLQRLLGHPPAPIFGVCGTEHGSQ